MATVFLRLLAHDDKPAALVHAVDRLRDGEVTPDVYVVDPESFRQVPGSPFSYWVSEKVRRLFTELPAFESKGRTVKQGLATADDFRFVRCWWEVTPLAIVDGAKGPKWRDDLPKFQQWCRHRTFEGRRWVHFAKGGDFLPYYSNLCMVVNWEFDGKEMKAWSITLPGTTHWSRRLAGYEFYFRPGLTWPLRGVRLSARAVPGGSCFSIAGKLATADLEEELIRLHFLMNSLAFDSLLRLSAGESRAQFEAGLIQRIPIVEKVHPIHMRGVQLASNSTRSLQSVDTSTEPSHGFHLPALLQVPSEALADRITVWQSRVANTDHQLAENQREIDDIAFRLYGIDGEDRRAMEEGSGLKTEPAEKVDDDEPGDDAGPVVEAKPLTASLFSYAVGCVIGRWDLRFATGERLTPELPDPFDPLPICSPGMLQDDDGLPLELTPDGYPLRIDWDGILVDDPDHDDDVVRRVRDVLEMIWKDRADAIEKEACEILGMADLRDYFRKPGAGGFWDDHVKRYSKSRRKAPIYWLLQSSKKNYALWIYYHRLDKDVLFKALLNYVEPKIRREESRAGELRSQKTALGTEAKGARKLDKELERQEAFLSELRDFEDKLRRAANLHLVPDLNDGVVLNIAPLRELVPWKEAKTYWDDLVKGEYNWSSIGKQLREKGLVR